MAGKYNTLMPPADCLFIQHLCQRPIFPLNLPASFNAFPFTCTILMIHLNTSECYIFIVLSTSRLHKQKGDAAKKYVNVQVANAKVDITTPLYHFWERLNPFLGQRVE